MKNFRITFNRKIDPSPLPSSIIRKGNNKSEVLNKLHISPKMKQQFNIKATELE